MTFELTMRMQSSVRSICLCLFVWASTVSIAEDLTKYVDPLIGTEGSPPNSIVGSDDAFSGPAVPFGVVKLGPDTTEFNSVADAFAGYTPDGNGMLLSVSWRTQR